jgi:hypothetical protein
MTVVVAASSRERTAATAEDMPGSARERRENLGPPGRPRPWGVDAGGAQVAAVLIGSRNWLFPLSHAILLTGVAWSAKRRESGTVSGRARSCGRGAEGPGGVAAG